MSKKKPHQAQMFVTEDLPLFSGTAPRKRVNPFAPTAVQVARLPGLDQPPDWEELAALKQRQNKEAR